MKLELLQDDFNDDAIDPAKWSPPVVVNFTVKELNHHLEFTTSPLGGSAFISSLNHYDLNDSYGFVQMVVPANQGTTAFEVMDAVSGYSLRWRVFGIFNQLIVSSGGFFISSVAYDPNVHKYLRVSIVGPTIFWDYSADAVTWTNLASQLVVATGKVFNNVISRMSVVIGAAPSVTISFDDFNILPTPPAPFTGHSLSELGSIFGTIDTRDNDGFRRRQDEELVVIGND